MRGVRRVPSRGAKRPAHAAWKWGVGCRSPADLNYSISFNWGSLKAEPGEHTRPGMLQGSGGFGSGQPSCPSERETKERISSSDKKGPG